MKILYFLLPILFYIIPGYSQVGIYEAKLKKEKAKIEQDAIKLKSELKKSVKSTAFLKQIIIDFSIDTFIIERLILAKQKLNPSNVNVANSYVMAEASYQKLLEKHYQLLLGKLNGQDQEILRQSQFYWMQLYNSEINFSNTISKDEYSGGGTMQELFKTHTILKFTKSRVVNVVQYLSRMQML